MARPAAAPLEDRGVHMNYVFNAYDIAPYSLATLVTLVAFLRNWLRRRKQLRKDT